jgi:hypothetical protein
MSWQDHKEFHETIGTYKSSGGTFPSAQYVLNSTTAGDRRPDIDQTVVQDEDLATTLPALTSKSYTIFNLTGASLGAYTLSSGDILPLLVNNPYYNTFSVTWGQTLMPANSAATVWVYAVPVTSSANSQAYRYLFVQPQWITQATSSSSGSLTTAVNTEALRLPSELNLGTLTTQIPELVCIGKIIIDFTTNWRLRAVTLLTGNKFSQIGSPSGNYLSTVATDATLTGNGTGASPLAVVQSYATKSLNNLASVAMNASLQWDNSAAQTLDIAPTADTVVGRALTISAGSTVTGGTADMAGGNLTLKSGLGKGTGASSIIFQTGTTLTTGSTLQTLSTKMTLLGNGNFGIGTVSPGVILDIQQAGTPTIKLFNTTTPSTSTDEGYILWKGKNSAGTEFNCAQIVVNTPVAGSRISNMHLQTGYGDVLSTVMTLSAVSGGGNVGIGTTSPTQLLQVGGSNGHNIQTGLWGGFGTEYSGVATVVGMNAIANTATAAGMHIIRTHASVGALAMRMNYSEGITLHTLTGSVTADDAFSSERMRITTAGNVGIGSTAPGARLQVVGSDSLNTSFSANLSGATGTGLVVTNSGNVGIGTTSPTAKLHLPAGTATASTAPLKLTSGVLNTAPEAGAIEFLTDTFYLTQTTGTIRRKIATQETSNFLVNQIFS